MEDFEIIPIIAIKNEEPSLDGFEFVAVTEDFEANVKLESTSLSTPPTNLDEVTPHLDEVKPHFADVKPHLEDVKPHFIVSEISLPRSSQKKFRQFEIFKCTQCKLNFASAEFLKVHNEAHKVIFTCSVCSQSYGNADELSCHSKLAHPELSDKARIILLSSNVSKEYPLDSRFSCPLCLQSFQSKSDLYKHNTIMHKLSRSHKCDLCNKCFYTKIACNNHQLSHPVVQNKLPQCKYCYRRFLTTQLLVNHTERIHEIHNCGQCPKRFANVFDLKVHASLHPIFTPTALSFDFEQSFSYNCPKCKEYFTNQSNFVTHKCEPKSKPNPCDFCGATFGTVQGLQRHKRQHLGLIMPCAVCNRPFETAKGAEMCRQRHEAIGRHKAIRRVKEKKFKYLEYVRHLKYQCSCCDTRFKLKRDLRNHVANCKPSKDAVSEV